MSYLVNAKTGATSLYDGLTLTSVWTSPDGRVFGTTATGIVELATDDDDDAGSDVRACVNFGKIALSGSLNRLTPREVYARMRSDTRTMLRVDGYRYTPSRFESDSHTQRFKLGKGLAGSYITPELYNVAGSSFDVDQMTVNVIEKARKI